MLKHEVTSMCVLLSVGGIQYHQPMLLCAFVLFTNHVFRHSLRVPSTGLVSRDTKRDNNLFLPLNIFDFTQIMLWDSAEVLLTTFRLKHFPGLFGHQGFKISIHHVAHLCNAHVHSPPRLLQHLDLFSLSYLYEGCFSRPTGKHHELGEIISAVSSYVCVPNLRKGSVCDSGASPSLIH